MEERFSENLQKKPIYLEKYGKKTLLSDEQASSLITEKIQSGEPFMVARLGASELNAIVNNETKLLQNQKAIASLDELSNNSGFFQRKQNIYQDFVN